jgi:hypothetical protein
VITICFQGLVYLKLQDDKKKWEEYHV